MSMSSSWSRTFTRCGLVGTSITLAILMTGCNSSSDSNTATITGTVFAAPIRNATCELQDTNQVSIIQDSFTTNAQGEYSVNIPTSRMSQDMILSCSGGTYTDEATGSTTSAGTLTAYVANGTIGDGDQIHATPESTIVQQLVSAHNMTLTAAQNAFNTAFNYNVDTSMAPTNAMNPAGNASDAQILAGLRAAAFSQLTTDLNLNATQQFELLAALARDLSDGQLDGQDAMGPIMIDGTLVTLPTDILNRFAVAIVNFRDSGNDNSGLTNDKLGTLPFARTVLTTNYKVEYLSSQMMTVEGQSQFQISVTDKSNDTAVTGITVTLMPMMHMSTMMHSTPAKGSCSENQLAPGTYDCTVFYLMPSVMASGISMGYWDLHVMLGMNETAHFYPTVMMAMGDTVRADLRGSGSDQIMSMTGSTENRRYHIFYSGLTSNNDFSVFIAARESMMSMPALISGIELSSGTMYAFTPAAISVEMSLDGANWATATTDNFGYWKASLVGLTATTTIPVYVKLMVSGEQKTTNGNAADNITDPALTNEYATFNVTPGGSNTGI